MNELFNYLLDNNTIVFTDTLKADASFISKAPRNHESLFFVTKGQLGYENNGDITIINKGQVGYIARGSVDCSYAYNCDETSYIAINFSFDRKSQLPVCTLPFKTLCSNGNMYNYEKMFLSALEAFSSSSSGRMAVCNGILLQIIGYLHNEYTTPEVLLKKIKKIDGALEYLKNNYCYSDFKIGILAEKCSMSEKNFRRLFYEIYKKSPYAFLQEYRINKAQILLLNTNKSISDIAYECGFSDVYSFSHSFKKHIGTSPLKYRNKN